MAGWGGWQGCANPCAVLCYAVLCYGVGVGAGVMRISGCRFIAFLARCASKDIKMCGHAMVVAAVDITLHAARIWR